MANLTETNRWEAGIYQLETSDPVMGGPNGIDNRPTRELANRTLWLKTELAKAVSSIGANKTAADTAIALKAAKAQRMIAGAGLSGGGDLSADRTIALAMPSTLNGSTANWAGNGATGHTHELSKATPTVAGVVKLVNVLDSSAADAAVSAAMAKKLQDEKLPKADLKFARPLVLSGSTAVDLDLADRDSIISNLGGSYIANGLNQLVLHNSAANHNVKNLPLKDKVYVQLDFYVMGGFSFIDCHYPSPNRRFRSKANWNNAILTLDWKENLNETNGVMLAGNQEIGGLKSFTNTLESKYRVMVRRNNEGLSPYQVMLDESVDLSGSIAEQKNIGFIEFRAGDSTVISNEGRAKATFKALLQPDKTCDIEAGTWDGANRYRAAWRAFGLTGNVAVGNVTDNGQGRLQVGGSVWAGGFLTTANVTWPKLQLCSTSGNQAMLVESGGVAGSHRIIIRPHEGGVVSGSNIAVFALPNVTGNKTLATTDDILQAANGAVLLTGNQTIAGTKTFSARADFAAGIRFSAASKDGWAELGMGASDIYMRNPASSKVLQLKDDGTLSYSNDKIMLASDKSDAVNLADSNKLATAAAAKTAYDRGSSALQVANQAAPSGAVAYFAGDAVPAGWLKANGAQVSRSVYAALFAAIGTRYGAGNGSTTFTLPDLRGVFPRGWDDGRGFDGGRVLGSLQEHHLAEHRHATGWRINNNGNEFALIRSNWAGSGHVNADVASADVAVIPGDGESYSHSAGGTHAVTNDRYATSRTYYDALGETRPVNVALMACIKI